MAELVPNLADLSEDLPQIWPSAAHVGQTRPEIGLFRAKSIRHRPNLPESKFVKVGSAQNWPSLVDSGTKLAEVGLKLSQSEHKVGRRPTPSFTNSNWATVLQKTQQIRPIPGSSSECSAQLCPHVLRLDQVKLGSTWSGSTQARSKPAQVNVSDVGPNLLKDGQHRRKLSSRGQCWSRSAKLGTDSTTFGPWLPALARPGKRRPTFRESHAALVPERRSATVVSTTCGAAAHEAGLATGALQLGPSIRRGCGAQHARDLDMRERAGERSSLRRRSGLSRLLCPAIAARTTPEERHNAGGNREPADPD